MKEERQPDGYVAAKRFLGDMPGWREVLRACLVVARRTNGEFAGSWVLNEASKFGIQWLPNLRPLVSYGILHRTGVARGGRRAYYAMVDIEGVRKAVADHERRVNEVAMVALGNAIYHYTFGIVGDGGFGAEGRSIATGIGLHWKGTYLIVTAAHVVHQTPQERLYFFIPSSAMHFSESPITATPPTCEMAPRFVLARPDLAFHDEWDLAAVRLDATQPEDGAAHFYELDDLHTTPSDARQIGFLGYPQDTRVPTIGKSFMATPYLDFGQRLDTSGGLDQRQDLVVSYPPNNSIQPYGLSGSGLWVFPLPTKKIWTPAISLVGLITQYDPKINGLIGYKVEKLIQFLKDL